MSLDLDELQYMIFYGPDANCTLALCPTWTSIQGYRPDLGANIAFLALFFISMVWHLAQGFRYKTWFFAAMAATGCIGEQIGYAGRIMLWQNPFSFNGFIIEICCITFSPVFYAAAIYVSLTRITEFLDRDLCRFPPQLYYWLFVPCDIVSLVLQAVGGALSSTSTGSDAWAVDISIAGLSFQVFTLLVFICLSGEYLLRYWRRRNTLPASQRMPFAPRQKIFAGFFTAAVFLILLRCCYRIAELGQGYTGPVFHDQGLFIALESVAIVAATFCLNIGHPGQRQMGSLEDKTSGFASDSSSPERA